MLQRITPSRLSAWEGSPVEGSEYTRQQLAVLARERPTWKSFSNLAVKLRGSINDGEAPAEPVIVQCPIIAWTKDRVRVLVIAPAGDKKWMDADLAFINGKGPRSADTSQT